MLRFLAPLLLTLSSVTSLQNRPYYVRTSHPTAASESQVRFAIENKYDDTGLGAKKPEFAYKTYKTLEDALVAYLDDPDTKLPEHEKAKAVHKLLLTFSRSVTPSSIDKPPSYHNAYQKPHSQIRNPFTMPGKYVYYHYDRKPAVPLPAVVDTNVLKSIPDKEKEPFKFKKFHTIKGGPLSLAHYTRDRDLKATFDQFDPHPKYTFSYGVHDKGTGDIKQAAETRDGDAVHGFYSYVDPNGQQRTVRYQSNDVQGFRATIKKLGPGLAK